MVSVKEWPLQAAVPFYLPEEVKEEKN